MNRLFMTSHRSAFLCAIFGFVAATFDTPAQNAPAGVLVGPNMAASLRNAGEATREQASVVRMAAITWASHAGSVAYRADQLVADFRMMQIQFETLRERFNWMGTLALQANRPQAGIVLGELDAGLNIVGEQLLFLQQQSGAGTLDHATLLRACRSLEDVMRVWEQELRRGRSRMGIY